MDNYCAKCGRLFKNKRGLRRHLMYKRRGEEAKRIAAKKMVDDAGRLFPEVFAENLEKKISDGLGCGVIALAVISIMFILGLVFIMIL